MIQRPQSILLFASALLYLALAFAPLWKVTVLNTYVIATSTASCMYSDGKILSSVTNIYLLACCAAGVILSLVTIFLFKNRLLQMKLAALNSGIVTIYLVLVIMLAIPSAKSLIMTADEGQFLWGFYLTLPAILTNFFANKLIRKDESLVKSVDRIR